MNALKLWIASKLFDKPDQDLPLLRRLFIGNAREHVPRYLATFRGMALILEAAEFVRTMAHVQGFKMTSPKSPTHELGCVADQDLPDIAKELGKSSYGKSVLQSTDEVDWTLRAALAAR